MISSALAILENEWQRNELSAFYEANKNRLYVIAFEYLHKKQDSEDAIQETFLRIANKPDKFFELSENKRIGYVCAIVRNVSVDMFKVNVKTETEEISEDMVFQDDYAPLENSLFDRISREEILDFISNLPVLQKNVLILTCLSELSIDDTAKILKVSKRVVNQRLYLARKAIKNYIEERSNKDE